MPGYKLIFEVMKNGEPHMRSDAETLADFFHMSPRYLQEKASTGGTIWMGDDKFTIRHTGERVPKKNPYEKPKMVKSKPKQSIKKVVAAARKAGMSYGQYVAMMEGRK